MTRDSAPLPIWRFALAAAALMAIAVATAAQLWIPLGRPIPGEFSDSVDYLLFADYFRGAFTGTLTPDLVGFFSVTRFPPLFPLALATIGAGLGTPMPAYWLTALTTIASFGLAAIWLSRECRSIAAGLALAAVTALDPGLHLLTLNPVSEPMFLAMTLLVLLWSPRIERGRGSLLVFAAFVGLLPLCRMAGVAIIAAAAVWLVLQRIGRTRDRIMAICVMLLPAVGWLAYRKLMPVTQAYADALSLDRMLAAFGGWQGWILGQTQRIADAYIELVSPWGHVPGTLIAIIAALFIAGWLLRLRRGTLDALALAFYLGLVFCWPYPAEVPRLIVVTLPMITLCLWEAARWLIERLPAMGASAADPAALVVAAAAIAASMPFVVEAAARATAPLDAELEPFKRSASVFRIPTRSSALELVELNARVAGVMDTIAETVAPGDCIYAFFPNALYAHGPSLDVRPMPFPPRDGQATPDQFSDCRYVLVTYQTSWQSHQPLLYPLAQARGWLEPQLVSRMKLRGQEVIAAALLRRVDPPKAR